MPGQLKTASMRTAFVISALTRSPLRDDREEHVRQAVLYRDPQWLDAERPRGADKLLLLDFVDGGVGKSGDERGPVSPQALEARCCLGGSHRPQRERIGSE